MALASDDFNVSLISPTWAPAVLDKPVLEASSLIATVTNNGYSVVILVTRKTCELDFVAVIGHTFLHKGGYSLNCLSQILKIFVTLTWIVKPIKHKK